MTVCRTMQAKYATFLEKKPAELELEDPEEGAATWAILADKGYNGVEQAIRAIVPPRENMRVAATPSSSASRGRGARDSATIIQAQHGAARVLCENFYGRKVRCFLIARNCFTSSMDKFKVVDDIMTALTNYHILKRPLRRDDAQLHRALLAEKRDNAKAKTEHKRERNAEYQRNFRRRIEGNEG